MWFLITSRVNGYVCGPQQSVLAHSVNGQVYTLTYMFVCSVNEQSTMLHCLKHITACTLACHVCMATKKALSFVYSGKFCACCCRRVHLSSGITVSQRSHGWSGPATGWCLTKAYRLIFSAPNHLFYHKYKVFDTQLVPIPNMSMQYCRFHGILKLAIH